jgi:hypothetical protein
MDMAAAHVGYVVASYVSATVCIAALCIFILGRDRALSLKVSDGKNDDNAP